MAQAYRQAGVNIEAGYEAVDRIKPHVKKTMRKGVMGGLGGFGGMFDLSELNYEKPVLVSGTDGVGTKLMLAIQLNQHDTIGIDCVAMCVNDVVAQGAEPLYFLDYIATGKLAPERVEKIVKGVAEGCSQAGCALIGGETAEMPDMYQENDYDLAGFTVGAVEKSKLITPENVKEGNILIGLASNGIHSNGFSLVRKVLLKDHKMDLAISYDELESTLGEALLAPTRIYVKPVLNVLKSHTVNGIAHITGGGFEENIPRMLPEGLAAQVDYGSWPIPPIFDLIEKKGNLSRKEMFTTFNMGVGMVLAVPEDEAVNVIKALEQDGERAYMIGRVVKGAGIEFGGGDLS
ncbi:phosphoribosylformylglycinamidine cyclo-ligase [Pseudalkalibacillus hwajinpoensis]|uniref:phosphoribosylformylglycinamidine cyclo-ligase n=1 Tax=Guptibacillus hwajinpoensis TaxID=208199 RepID=UPI001CD2EA28|nr:phosphoribosylformylglycinamidine cyclo-ligase [Pseudalkalibacillus hwajinpoensis]MCA0992772.1 phosphoribosylformylglycinamidine cyclo-ligase [Pseudalkalibacillus hwajinpoensis]